MNRRRILTALGGALPASIAGCLGGGDGRDDAGDGPAEGRSSSDRISRGTPADGTGDASSLGPVYLASVKDGRTAALSSLLDRVDPNLDGQRVAVKANFNSADPFPASTHPDTLDGILTHLGDADVVLAERSGMGETRTVLEALGILDLATQRGVEVTVLDALEPSRWSRVRPPESHWREGFLLPDVFTEADDVVQTCCLKTHRYGGHFTMSLKNSVGMVAETDPETGHDYMQELHTAGHQREKIAEINTAYEPAFVVMDGVAGFSHGGPASGKLIDPGVLLASRDRVALDAAGVAILRSFGTTAEVSQGPVFDQTQIARAVELGLGAAGPQAVELVAVDADAEPTVDSIRTQLGE